jgi:Zn-dependent protease
MALSFRLGKIPVRVQVWFFVLAAFLGASDPEHLALWVAIVFASVLLHELGHAAMGMSFGLHPSIELHGMGGTTSWTTAKPLSTLQRVAISLAGPFAGFAAGAAVVGMGHAGVFPSTDLWRWFTSLWSGGWDTPADLRSWIRDSLLFVNIVWGIFNLLPMLPLDGGNVMFQLLNAATRGRGERPARVVSMGLAVLLGGFVMLRQLNWWGALLALSFIAMNYQALKALKARENDEPMRSALKQAYDALDARDAERVLALARPIALTSRTAQVRAEALQLVAFGFLLEGRVADADSAIAALPDGYAPNERLLEMRAAAITAVPTGA